MVYGLPVAVSLVLAVDVVAVLVPAIVALAVSALAALLAHLYKVRQWRYERRFDVFAEFMAAGAALIHRTSGLLEDAEVLPTERGWAEVAVDLNNVQERVTAALGGVQLVASAATVDAATELFVAAMNLHNMAARSLDERRRFDADESARYQQLFSTVYRPAGQRFTALPRAD